MKRFHFALLLIFFGTQLKAELPWQKIADGNAYWATHMGVSGYEPSKQSTAFINSLGEVKADPSLYLLNAVMRYQIDNHLHSNELKSFADSMLHVALYISGGSPMKKTSDERAGWWGLSYPVAMRYGLKIDAFSDERNDFEKSTKAAMKYAKDLNKKHGENWLAMFVEGPTNVSRFRITEKYALEDNLNAMYKLMVLSSYTNAESYAVEYYYKNVGVRKISEPVLVDLIIEKTGMRKADFYVLNPSIVGNMVPEKSKLYMPELAIRGMDENWDDIVLLSESRTEEKVEKIERKEQKIAAATPDPSTTKSTIYRVRSGDNLGYIAEKYSVGVSQLRSWNNLRSDKIFVGQKLVIYGKEEPKPVTASVINSAEKKTKKSALAKGEYVTYKVKSGDTLWSIAKKFPGVSADNLMQWNGISSSINVGQNIKVKKSEIRNYSAADFPETF